MSGGSFNYLCDATSVSALAAQSDDIEKMAGALASIGAGDAASATLVLLKDIDDSQRRIEKASDRLRDVWRAVEWWRSNDWSQAEVEKALTAFRT
jgi:predicted transcriptional regulator